MGRLDAYEQHRPSWRGFESLSLRDWGERLLLQGTKSATAGHVNRQKHGATARRRCTWSCLSAACSHNAQTGTFLGVSASCGEAQMTHARHSPAPPSPHHRPPRPPIPRGEAPRDGHLWLRSCMLLHAAMESPLLIPVAICILLASFSSEPSAWRGTRLTAAARERKPRRRHQPKPEARARA